MSIFGSIMGKIFHHDAAPPPAAAPDATPTDTAPKGDDVLNATAVAAAAPADPAPTEAAAAPPTAPVDVEAVLTGMASTKGGGGNWQTSIVDLLKLLDLDSSLNARKELANELNLHVAADGSAEENIALHHAVMEKLAENGGKVPASLRG